MSPHQPDSASGAFPLFFLHVQTPRGLQRAADLLPFASAEDAFCDICAAIPATATDMLRVGIDPMLCSYLICDPAEQLVMEVPFAELVRPKPPVRARSYAPTIPRRRAAPLLARSDDILSAAEAAHERASYVLETSQEIHKRAQALMDDPLWRSSW